MEWWRVGGEESRCGQREREWTLQSNLSSGHNFRRCYWNWSIFVVTRIRWKVFKERKVSAPNKFLSVRFPHWTQDFSFHFVVHRLMQKRLIIDERISDTIWGAFSNPLYNGKSFIKRKLIFSSGNEKAEKTGKPQNNKLSLGDKWMCIWHLIAVGREASAPRLTRLWQPCCSF